MVGIWETPTSLQMCVTDEVSFRIERQFSLSYTPTLLPIKSKVMNLQFVNQMTTKTLNLRKVRYDL